MARVGRGGWSLETAEIIHGKNIANQSWKFTMRFFLSLVSFPPVFLPMLCLPPLGFPCKLRPLFFPGRFTKKVSIAGCPGNSKNNLGRLGGRM